MDTSKKTEKIKKSKQYEVSEESVKEKPNSVQNAEQEYSWRNTKTEEPAENVDTQK